MEKRGQPDIRSGSKPLVGCTNGRRRSCCCHGGSPPEDQDLPPGQLDRVIPNGTVLVAFDLNNGKEKWKVGDDLVKRSSPRLMKIGGKDAVIAFCRGGLLAVELETGRQLWKYDHRASI